MKIVTVNESKNKTITYSLDNISNIIDSIGIKSEKVIFKPFNFYELFSILK